MLFVNGYPPPAPEPSSCPASFIAAVMRGGRILRVDGFWWMDDFLQYVTVKDQPKNHSFLDRRALITVVDHGCHPPPVGMILRKHRSVERGAADVIRTPCFISIKMTVDALMAFLPGAQREGAQFPGAEKSKNVTSTL